MATVQELLSRVDELKGELDALRPLPKELEDRVLQKFRLWWTYHSNAIEGNKLTQGETEMFLMEGLTAKGKPLKDHLDLRGHSNAINFLLGLIRDKQVLTEAEIRKLQEVLLVEPYQVQAITPDGQPTMKTVALGQYKTQPNHVRTPTGEMYYYATPEETPAKMHDLLTWLREETARGVLHPVEIAARFHHRFTAIHPFDDGNGRMSRLLMNLLLMQGGYPPVVIRISERDEYLAALRRADRDEYEDFVAFIAEHVVASLELYIRAARGEDIHEPTDLEKEIALLKLELQHIEEPQPLASQIQKKLFEHSLELLHSETLKLVKPLCDLFSQSLEVLSGSFGNERSTQGIEVKYIALGSSTSLLRDEKWWSGGSVVKDLRLIFELKGFKKGRFDAFDISARFDFLFEPLKYTVQIPMVQPPFVVQHFYQEPLTKDEIAELAQRIARFLFEYIRKKTQ